MALLGNDGTIGRSLQPVLSGLFAKLRRYAAARVSLQSLDILLGQVHIPHVPILGVDLGEACGGRLMLTSASRISSKSSIMA